MRTVVARAHANIAMVKYWGKRDETLNLPMTGSISMTVDKLFVTTSVTGDTRLGSDQVFIDGVPASAVDQIRVSQFLDVIRGSVGQKMYALVRSENRVPPGAGLASSSAAYAALAMAATRAFGGMPDVWTLSRIARRGSGSAARSIFGGWVQWHRGTQADGSDSLAEPILGHRLHDMVLQAVVVNAGAKTISSCEGMRRTVETSPFYEAWLEAVENDLVRMRQALDRGDFAGVGQIAEANAWKMHATTMGADPPFIYWEGFTFDVIRRVQSLRRVGVQAYFTIDAGPHVVVLCQRADVGVIREAMLAVPGVKQVWDLSPGPGAQIIDECDG